jgi:hypothetical protein
MASSSPEPSSANSLANRRDSDMSIIPPDALTAVQLVSGLVASAKNAVDLAKTSSNRDLQAAVSELLNGVIDIKLRMVELDEEVSKLKAKLAQREDIEGPDARFGYFCFKSKPDQPLCQKCYQSAPSKVVYMGPRDQRAGGIMRFCTVCNFTVVEQERRNVNRIPEYNPYS